MVDGSALVRAACREHELARHLVADLRDRARADVPGARWLRRHLGPEDDRHAWDGAPVELHDAALPDTAEDLAAEREVRAQVVPDADEALRAARDPVVPQTE